MPPYEKEAVEAAGMLLCQKSTSSHSACERGKTCVCVHGMREGMSANALRDLVDS